MSPPVVPLENPIQDYSWGSTTAIAEFLGRPNPAAIPQAELWIGAHPKAPSRVLGAQGETLDALIRSDPRAMLGPAVAERYGELPFLLKILAAAEPLSIQCHPNQEQARDGFARENEAGVPLSAAHRNYRDPNHKPELLVALTSFHALQGFRPIGEILDHLRPLGSPEIEEPLDRLEGRRDVPALKYLFSALLGLDQERRRRLLDRTVAAARGREDPAWRWVGRLDEKHPGDVGVLAPLFLNLVELQPEQALFLGAGELHAHLEGTGIELMANSDNVLRGGLTLKHVDVASLLAVARFEPGPPGITRPKAKADGEWIYPTPAAEFELGVVEVSENAGHVSPPGHGVELLLGLRGDARLLVEGREHPLGRGRSLFVPAAAPVYRIEGQGRVCRARVPPEPRGRLHR